MSMTERQRLILDGKIDQLEDAPAGMNERQREILYGAQGKDDSGRLGKLFRQAEDRASSGGKQASRIQAAGLELSPVGGLIDRVGDKFDETFLTNSEGGANLLGRAANMARGLATENDSIPRDVVGGPDVSNEERAYAIRDRAPGQAEVDARQRVKQSEAAGLAPKGVGEIRGLKSLGEVFVENAAASLPYMGANMASGPLNLMLNPSLYGGEAVSEIDDTVGIENVDLQTLAALTASSGSLMGALDKIGITSMLQGLGRKELAELVASKGVSKLLISKGVPQTVANVAETALVEAGTEALQEGVVMGAAGLAGAEYTPGEVAKRMGTAGATGGIVGGGIRGGTEAAGAVVGNRDRGPNNGETDLGADETIQQATELAQENQALQAQAEAEQLAEVRAQKAVRLKYAPEFTKEKDFYKQREAARLNEVLTPGTEAGDAFVQWQMDNDLTPQSPEEQSAQAKEFLKQSSSSDDAQLARQEFLTALDQFSAQRATEDANAPLTLTPEQQVVQGDPNMAAPVAQDAGEIAPLDSATAQPPAQENTAPADAAPEPQTAETQPQAPAEVSEEVAPKKPNKKEAARQRAEEALGPDWEANNPELSQAVEDGKSIYAKGKGKKARFDTLLDQAVAEANPEPEPEVAAQPEAAPEVEATPAAAALSEMDQRAETYATENLGPDWRETNADLAADLKAKRYASFNRRVDELTPAVDNTPAADAGTGTGTDVSFASELPNRDALSENENKVWTAVADAFANDGTDTVIQPDGKWNTTKIAELAGLNSRQAAQTAMTRLRPKLAKAYGKTQEEIVSALRARGQEIRQGEAAPDINDGASVFDAAELGEGGSTGTVASVNQGAREGLDKADIEYMEARSAEPDQYENKRQELADKRRVTERNNAVSRSGRKALFLWNSLSQESGAGVSVQSLSKADLSDWVMTVDEFESGAITEQQLIDDHRGIETLYDATGGITQESIDENPTAVEGRDAESEGGAAQTGGSPEVVESSGSQTEPGRGADTGTARDTDTGVVGEAKKAPVVEVKKKRKLPSGPRMSISEAQAQANPTKADSIRNAMKWLTGMDDNWRVNIVRSPDDLIGAIMAQEVPLTFEQLGPALDKTPFGFVAVDPKTGITHAYFFTDNITPGGERAAVMHEVGGHIGMDSILTPQERQRVVTQIGKWATSEGNSLEKSVAVRTIARVEGAVDAGAIGGRTEEEVSEILQSEYVAYFIEEAVRAGVNPTADGSGPLHKFVRDLWDSFKKALRKINGDNDVALFAQDLVNMAAGAARLELTVDPNNDPDVDTGTDTDTPRFGVGPQPASAESKAESSTQQGALARFMGEGTAAQLKANLTAAYQNPLDSTKFLSRFIRDAKDAMPSASAWYDSMLAAQQTRNELLGKVEEIAGRARSLPAERLALVNDFLGTSTFFQKWGYDPKIEGKDVTIDPIMKKKFDRLSAEEQQVVRDIFQHGEDYRTMLNDTAQELGIPKMFTFDSKLDGPYAPLKRFGNHAAVLKSQTLLDAEAAFEQNDSKINAQRVEKLKGEPEHYVVSFFDTPGAAAKFATENKKEYAFTSSSERSPSLEEGRIANPQVFEKVLGAMSAGDNSGLDSQTVTKLREMVKDMYFQTLDESNARLAGARRLNRAGFDKDMVRSFVAHGRGQASMLAQMKHGAEINKSLIKAEKEAAKDRDNLQRTYNIMATKYRNVLTPRTGKLAQIEDNILAFNTVYMLTSNIGYHITNATQPVISVSQIAGDFGQYSKVWGSLIRGYKVSMDVVNGGFLSQLGTAATVGFVDLNNQITLDVDKAPPKYQDLLRTMQLRNLLDVGIEEDLNLENRFDTGSELLNKVPDTFRKITHRLYQVARYVEAHNRVSSAIAAYDMAAANPAKVKRMKMTPQEYAINVVQDTQGNFSQLDAPLIMDTLPKMTTQFRKYQFMMAWLHGAAFKNAFKGETAEVRTAGRRTLGYLVGHTAALSGLAGVPAFNLAYDVVNMLMGDDEDEPKDFERWAREKLDGRMADLVTRGVPAAFGIDMSTKLSQGDIFLPWNPKYNQVNTDERDGWTTFLAKLAMGPSSTLVTNFQNTAQFLGDGNIVRAAEYGLPRGIRSAIESYRYGTEGYELRNGDVIADARTFSLFDLATNAIGLPSTDINKIKWTRGQQWELENYFTTESSSIRQQYVEASNARDRGSMAELREEWRELQKAKDRVRPFFNNPKAIKRQPVTNLLKAPQQQRKREREYRREAGN